MTLPRAMTTVEVADQINMVLGARAYTDRTIRAEIDCGALIACRNAKRRSRRSILVTETEFLRWAAKVLSRPDFDALTSRRAS